MVEMGVIGSQDKDGVDFFVGGEFFKRFSRVKTVLPGKGLPAPGTC